MMSIYEDLPICHPLAPAFASTAAPDPSRCSPRPAVAAPGGCAVSRRRAACGGAGGAAAGSPGCGWENSPGNAS